MQRPLLHRLSTFEFFTENASSFTADACLAMYVQRDLLRSSFLPSDFRKVGSQITDKNIEDKSITTFDCKRYQMVQKWDAPLVWAPADHSFHICMGVMRKKISMDWKCEGIFPGLGDVAWLDNMCCIPVFLFGGSATVPPPHLYTYSLSVPLLG